MGEFDVNNRQNGNDAEIRYITPTGQWGVVELGKKGFKDATPYTRNTNIPTLVYFHPHFYPFMGATLCPSPPPYLLVHPILHLNCLFLPKIFPFN
jgi:hypothetical protein